MVTEPALQLAALERYVNVRRALIACNNSRLGGENIFQKLRDMISDRGRACGTAFGRLGSLPEIVNGLVRTVAANNKYQFGRLRCAEPIKFRPVELHFLTADQLVHVDARIERAEREPSGFAML